MQPIREFAGICYASEEVTISFTAPGGKIETVQFGATPDDLKFIVDFLDSRHKAIRRAANEAKKKPEGEKVD